MQVFDLVDQPLYANMEVIQSGDQLPFGRTYDNIGSPWEFKVRSVGCMGPTVACVGGVFPAQ